MISPIFQEFENTRKKIGSSLWIKSKPKSGERTVAAKKIMEKASVKYCCVINPARLGLKGFLSSMMMCVHDKTCGKR